MPLLSLHADDVLYEGHRHWLQADEHEIGLIYV
jgi:hypothetical protein